jgi:hypothetical protein
MKSQRDYNMRLVQNDKDLPETIKHLLSTTEMRFDIEKGWYNIVEKFLKFFVEIDAKEVEVVQIKQKFGELRIYLHISNLSRCSSEDMEKYLILEAEIKNAEVEASATCELCGGHMDDVGNIIIRAPRFWRWNCCDKCFDNKCEELKVEKKI